MGFLKGCYGNLYGILMEFPVDSYGISMAFRYFYDVSMGFLWDYFGSSIMFF
jgi:hypothetical protein